jgi:hypothetical protein
MLSSRTEMIVVGALIVHIASGFRLQPLQDLLSTFVGKVLALGGIIYVHKKLSCSVALLLAIAYLRCCATSWEGFTTPTTTVTPTVSCPDGYAMDAITNSCKPSSSMSGSVPAPPESTTGASVTTPPPNGKLSTAPMTTPTATMPPVSLPPSIGGVQPSGGATSTAASV